MRRVCSPPENFENRVSQIGQEYICHTTFVIQHLLHHSTVYTLSHY